MTWDELHKKAEEDYKAALGRVVLVSHLTCYMGEDSVDLDVDPPARMRVIQTPVSDLQHRVDQWLDPYWNLELLDYHPKLNGARSFWTFGKSYNLNGEVEPTSNVVFEDQQPPKEGP